MGLFSLLLAASVAGIIAFSLFVVMALFLPWRLAVRMALGAAIGGLIGFAGTLFVQTPFYPEKLITKASISSYLIIAGLGGLLGALLCARMVWQISRKAN